MNNTQIKVLLVDDSKEQFMLIEDLFIAMRDSRRFALQWVSNYDEARQVMALQAHDVYLLDYDLGARNSLDLLREIFPGGCPVPIIMITGRGNYEVDEQALALGIADYFNKTDLRSSVLERTIRYVIEQKRVETELRTLYQQVRELEQLKTDIIRIAAHDLMSPMMMMMNYIQLLQGQLSSKIDNEQVELLDIMHHTLARMQQIVRDILTLERVTSTDIERIDITALLRDILPAYQLQSAQKNQRLHTHIANAPAIIEGSTPLLREAFVNLISNAIKYTPQEGKITVSLDCSEDRIHFEVSDTGFGIPTDQQPHLFKPFFRAKSPHTANIEGTGLGLYLVKRIIDQHRGSLTFTSIEGKGSTFAFDLPMK